MKLFIFFIILFSNVVVKAQLPFEAVIGTSITNEFAIQTIEKSNGNFIIAGARGNGNQNYTSPYFVEIDKYGNFVQDNFLINPSRHFYYNNILEFNSKIIVVGVLFSDYSSATYDSIIISELDSNLNLKNTKQILLDTNTIDISSAIYSQVFFDSVLMISGYGIKANQNNVSSFVYTLNSNYSILNQQVFALNQGFGLTEFYNYLFNKEDSLYYGYARGGICALKTDLSIDTLYNSTLPVYKTFLSENGTKKYMLGLTTDNRIFVYELNNHFDTINSRLISVNLNYTYPANTRCISPSSSYLYIGIADSINPIDIWWGNHDSKLLLTKIDTLGNTIWIKTYGSDGYYYLLYDVLATNDGGCLLTACSYKYSTNSLQKDIIILKLDSNGNTTWTQNISQPEVKLMLYPNPTTNQLNLQLISPNQSIRSIQIFDIQGKEVLNKQSNSAQLKLDVSSLLSGVYIIKGQTDDCMSFSRKFVKE